MPACAHCGLDVPAGLVRAGEAEQFCCAGCRSAHALIAGCDLGGYYRLRAQVGGGADPGGDDAAQAAAAVAAEGEAFVRAHLRPAAGGLAAMRWQLAGMHCAACVWLLERLPLIEPGIRSARVEFAAGRIEIVADPARCPPARQAALLVRLGYRPRPDDGGEGPLRGERRDLLLRLAVAAAAAVTAMHLSLNLYAGEHARDLDPAAQLLFAGLALAAAAPAVGWSALPIWRAAWAGLRHRSIGVDAAAALAIATAAIASAANLLRGSREIYADAATMFIALLLVGRLAVVEARLAAARGHRGLAAVLPATARRRRGADWRPVATGELAAGDLVEVRPGERIPGDGLVEDSAGAVENAVLTGESRPLAVAAGDAVVAGSSCRAGPLRVRLTAVGEATRIGRLLAEAGAAAGAPRRRRRLADAVQAWFVPASLAAAAAVGAGWWWHAGPAAGLGQAVAVLLVTCPCALGLAAPLVGAAAVAALAGRGVLVRDAGALDDLAAGVLRHAVLDKTGTLTEGRARVAAAGWTAAGRGRAGLVHALAARSGHPVALAVAESLAAQADPAAAIADVREIPGRGLVAAGPDGEIRLGSPAHAGADPAALPLAADAGHALAVAAGPDGPWAVFRISDPLHPAAPALVDDLRRRGMRPHLASGDDAAVTAAVAARLGIADVHGACPPEAKAALAERLGDGVLAVGDGVNDAAALSRARVAIGVRGGIAGALAACHIYIARPDAIAGLRDALGTADAARRRVRLLIAMAAVYNAGGIAAAAAGWWGPYLCAVAMPASSVAAVLIAWLPLRPRAAAAAPGGAAQ